MRKTLFTFLYIIIANASFGQLFKGQIPEDKKYDAKKIIDPTYGIIMYEKLNFGTGGDSVRNDHRGYAVQGDIVDYYTTGEILHQGYYEDGHLKIYKNFYPNGVVERSFQMTDYNKCSMKIYYDNGKLKSDITYYQGSAQVWTDYYPNGQIEYLEENAKSMEYLIQRKSFAEDGKPQEIFELVDKKKKLNSKKEYSENGNIKAEGPMMFNKNLWDYQKNGKWTVYDEQGKASTENWINGEEQK
jgi:antitoxin component YwqK of YwqJK toxin-antitoxin module